MKTFQRLAVTAILAASALLAAGCSENSTQATPTSSASAASTQSAVKPSQTTSPSSSAPTAPDGIIAKGVANDGKGNYLQTTITDADPAMKYNPAITDAAAKAHYSEADLAEAQKVIVKFIAEEVIDSTLNGGGTDVDGWMAAHKDEILPANQSVMLEDLKSGKGGVAREPWMADKPGYSYVHGDNTPRVVSRTITPSKFRFVESGNIQGVMLDTTANYGMKVTGGSGSGIQKSTAEISVAAAKDPADGKWKIAGYNTNFHTAEG